MPNTVDLTKKVPSPAGEGCDEGKLKVVFPQFISPSPLPLLLERA